MPWGTHDRKAGITRAGLHADGGSQIAGNVGLGGPRPKSCRPPVPVSMRTADHRSAGNVRLGGRTTGKLPSTRAGLRADGGSQIRRERMPWGIHDREAVMYPCRSPCGRRITDPPGTYALGDARRESCRPPVPVSVRTADHRSAGNVCLGGPTTEKLPCTRAGLHADGGSQIRRERMPWGTHDGKAAVHPCRSPCGRRITDPPGT